MWRLLPGLRTGRYLAYTLGGCWLLLLLALHGRGSHGLLESTHDELRETFQLPTAEQPVEWPIPRTLLSGRFKVSPSFDMFAIGFPWFELSLPAEERDGIDPPQFVAIENLRLFKADGSLLCELPQRFALPLRAQGETEGEGLELALQLDEYPGRFVRTHTVEVEWSQYFYSQGCLYKQPAWVVADVVRNRQVTAPEPLWLKLGAERSSVAMGDSSATAVPGALPGEWRLELINLGRQSLHFVPAPYPPHRGERRVRYAPYGSLDGLWNKLIRRESFLAADIYRLRFVQDVPAGLPLRVILSEEERVKNVHFSSAEQNHSLLDKPSPWRIPLAHTELDFPEDLPQQHQAEEFHELFLPISLSAVCQLRVVHSGAWVGQPLHWRPVRRLPYDDYRGYTLLPPEYLDRVRWELQTSDGAQRFFHDLSVQSELLCPNRMAWQTIPYQTGPRPWLVDLAQLPASAIRRDRPARELFGRVRFIDAAGQALMPIARNEDLSDPLLAEFIHAGERLKFHGEVVRVEHLNVLDLTPRRMLWDYRFRSLDVY